MSLYSTIVCSSCCLSSPSICDPSHLNMFSLLDSWSFVGSSCSFFMSSLISFKIRRCIGVCSASFPGFSGVGNQRFSSFCSLLVDFMSSLTYICVSSGSCRVVSVATSMGLICFVSSGLRIWSSANFVWFFIVWGKSVKLAILMFILLLWAVANAGAMMMVADSSNCGSGCIAPVTSVVLVVMTIALTVVVCCGGRVWFPSAMI